MASKFEKGVVLAMFDKMARIGLEYALAAFDVDKNYLDRGDPARSARLLGRHI